MGRSHDLREAHAYRLRIDYLLFTKSIEENAWMGGLNDFIIHTYDIQTYVRWRVVGSTLT